MKPKIFKVTIGQAKAVNALLKQKEWTKTRILYEHENSPNSWQYEAEPLNGLDLNALNALLFNPELTEVEASGHERIADIYREANRIIEHLEAKKSLSIQDSLDLTRVKAVVGTVDIVLRELDVKIEGINT